jgi:hypothetical protein
VFTNRLNNRTLAGNLHLLVSSFRLSHDLLTIVNVFQIAEMYNSQEQIKNTSKPADNKDVDDEDFY